MAADDACRILVVDDNADLLESLSEVLRLLGHDVFTAGDGESALLIGRANSPHLVIMDVGMPGVDGYDIARRMRAEMWGRVAMLVALTGWGSEGDRTRALAAGFDVHEVKPLELPRLLELIAGASSRRIGPTTE